MTAKEIDKLARINTHVGQRTFVWFEDGTEIGGYFDSNIPGSENLKQNKWNFVIQPQSDMGKEVTVINGDNIVKIEIHDGPIAEMIQKKRDALKFK